MTSFLLGPDRKMTNLMDNTYTTKIVDDIYKHQKKLKRLQYFITNTLTRDDKLSSKKLPEDLCIKNSPPCTNTSSKIAMDFQANVIFPAISHANTIPSTSKSADTPHQRCHKDMWRASKWNNYQLCNCVIDMQ